MALVDNFNFDKLKNEAENFVLVELERQLDADSEHPCRCDECILDMAAIALNTVKPLYRVSLLGTLYAASAMDQKTYASSVKDAVSRAVEKVRKNPGHEIAAGDGE